MSALHKIETRLFIDGKFVDGHSGKKFPLINPATEEVVVEVNEADEYDVDEAVAAAKKAFPAWSKSPPEYKASLLRKLAELIRRDVDELGYLEAISMGRYSPLHNQVQLCVSPVGQYVGVDPMMAAGAFEDYAGLINYNRGETSVTQDGYLNLVLHQPFGVVGAIIPWNVPLIMFAWKVGAALATGNTVVLKSSEKAPLTSIKLASLIKEAGFPPGVVNILAGYGIPSGKAIAEHMDIRKISFTGSVRTGRLIQEMSAKSNLKNVTLELGGKTPAIIFDDADLSIAVPATQFSIQWNSGQVCIANSRIYVHEKIAEQFKTEFKKQFTSAKIGDPLDKTTNHGPQADKIQFDNVSRYIESGKKSAKLLVGGERAGDKGYFVKPTIFVDAPEQSEIVKEEIFGPVVVINTFTDEDDIIAKANDSEFGLYASVFTKDIDRAIRVVKALESGSVSVNCASPSGAAGFPFGGYKASGLGREGGLYSMKAFSETKTVIIKIADYAGSSLAQGS